VVHQDPVAGVVGQADHALEGRERHLVADGAGGALHGGEDHGLGVDEQAVHIEHDGFDGTRQGHGAV
jgi:hypothetical protein